MNSWLQRFNRLPPKDAAGELLACCASRAWANAVAAERPFADAEALLRVAESVWWHLPAAEWLTAFAAHPRIGEAAAARPQHGAGDNWSTQEQQGATRAAESTKAQLAEVNREYDAKFGYTYIVCATGKSGQEMLQLARERLANDPAVELRIAAGEQARITRLRLQRLLNQAEGVERNA